MIPERLKSIHFYIDLFLKLFLLGVCFTAMVDITFGADLTTEEIITLNKVSSVSNLSDSQTTIFYDLITKDEISNETIYVDTQIQSVELDLSEFREVTLENFRLVNETLDDLDFTEYNDSEKISDLRTQIMKNFSNYDSKLSSLQESYNKLTGNVSSEFNLQQIINTQMQLAVAKDVQKQMKEIFADDEVIDFSNYYNKTTIDEKLKKAEEKASLPNDLARKDDIPGLQLVFMWIFIVVLVFGLIGTNLYWFFKSRELELPEEIKQKIMEIKKK